MLCIDGSKELGWLASQVYQDLAGKINARAA